jgi:hypothetical protein
MAFIDVWHVTQADSPADQPSRTLKTTLASHKPVSGDIDEMSTALCSYASMAPHNYFRITVSMSALGWQTTRPEFSRSFPDKSINSAITKIGISPVQRHGH